MNTGVLNARRLAERAAHALGARTSRRSFIGRTAVVGSALAVTPLRFILRPGTAYAAVCGCGGRSCGCSAPCCDGYTEFCCSITGSNTCPPGTFMGGWWKADRTSFCAGPRYYIDCNGVCQCGCGGHFCPGCDGLTCECGNGDCNLRHVGCTAFRYGQCHTEIGCSGRILCRVVSCTAPWVLDPACSTVSATDNSTGPHDAACLHKAAAVGMAAAPDGKGYWIVATDGSVHAFGSAGYYGSMDGQPLLRPIVGMAADVVSGGYWLVASDGGVFAFNAPFDGSTGGTRLNDPVVGIAAPLDARGYWLVASDGGVFAFDVPFEGSTGALDLNKPVVAMAPTKTGKGYWLVASDGGVFAFGDAVFRGGLGDKVLNQPIVGMAPTVDGKGYWLVAADGGVFAFGTAKFFGSMGGTLLNAPIVGMAATPANDGYWMVASDGGVFAFGNAGFYGAA
ncbi:MAG: hypothetical protein QOK43_2532 [Acidimicrobiaceae bacterium]|nr:hypothetical protein [Acidimicrobiaceae bacterium]